MSNLTPGGERPNTIEVATIEEFSAAISKPGIEIIKLASGPFGSEDAEALTPLMKRASEAGLVVLADEYYLRTSRVARDEMVARDLRDGPKKTLSGWS